MAISGRGDPAVDVLGERVEALAAALRNAGVDPNTAARLLGTAAAAALDAVTLGLLLDDAPAPASAVRPAERPEADVLTPLAA